MFYNHPGFIYAMMFAEACMILPPTIYSARNSDVLLVIRPVFLPELKALFREHMVRALLRTVLPTSTILTSIAPELHYMRLSHVAY
jgi:hypothetical protein